MEGLVGLAALVIGLIIIYVIFQVILQKWPVIIPIISIFCGLGIWSFYTWWLGIIAFFLVNGILFGIMTHNAHKCSHCNSYNTEVREKKGNRILVYCNKCKNFTYFYNI